MMDIQEKKDIGAPSLPGHAGQKARYTITVETSDDANMPAIVRIRHMLKRMWRDHAIRCTGIAPTTPIAEPARHPWACPKCGEWWNTIPESANHRKCPCGCIYPVVVQGTAP